MASCNRTGPRCQHDSVRLSAAGAARDFVVGVVGRITQAKGHHVLLRASAKVRSNEKANLTLLVVGEPLPGCAKDLSYLRSLKSLASELGFSGRIVWAGYHDNPSPHYSVMDVLVFPSICSDGLPLVLLEAMSRGIPVIASRVGGVPEVIEDGVNGFLVPPGDADSLKTALDRFLDEPRLVKKMGEAARTSIDDRFSPGTFQQTIQSLIRELCSTPPLVETVRRGEEVTSWR